MLRRLSPAFGFALVLPCLALLPAAPAQAAACAAAWSCSTTYGPGSQASFGGNNYTMPYTRAASCPGFNPSLDNWWTNNGACGGAATPTTAAPTATATRAPNATATTPPRATPTTGSGTCTAPTCNTTTIYVGNTTCSLNGHTWMAKWWTQGELPPGTTGVWQDNGACSGGGATPTRTTAPRSTPTATTPARATATATATSAATSDGRNWKGRTWNISNGGMAGVIPANPSNVFVDASGFLHLRIVNNGGSYTGAETFTSGLLGFGTYQWQIQGPIDNMDKSTVLGLFPYGPAAGVGVGGENEIDIEFSKWNNSCGCNADFSFWPSTGNGALGSASDLFTINLAGGNLVTARFVWRSTSIVGTIMSGLQPIGTTANVLRTFTLAPSNYMQRIPQQPMPLGMNLWSFEVPPSSNQEVIIRDFQYAP